MWFRWLGRGAIEVKKGTLKPKLDHSEKSYRESKYQASLRGAEAAMDLRFSENSCPKASLGKFEILGQIGSGGSSGVFKVRYREDNRIFALKAQKKAGASPTKAEAIVREKKLLYALRSEFVVKLIFAFQDSVKLYMVLEYAKYGDLESCKQSLSEFTLKFVAAQIVLGLEYLHKCNVVHRDVMPKNILIFEDGYLKLSDFGHSRILRDRAHSLKGTYAFMAPEMFGPGGYGKAVDYWALGVTIFRLMYEKHPYPLPKWEDGKFVHGIGDAGLDFPPKVDRSSPIRSFLSAILEKDANKRLGGQQDGASEIRQHHWFAEVSFFDVYEKSVGFKTNLAAAKVKSKKKYDFLVNESMHSRSICASFFDDF